MEQEEMECVDAECCHMCFSTERKLTSLDGVVDVYLLIVGLTPGEESMKDVRSCWECRAVLQRIRKFRRQVRWARDVLITADALLLDSDTCLSKLKFTAIEKINLKEKLNLDILRNVFEIDIAPACTDNVNKLAIFNDTKVSSARSSTRGKIVKQNENEQFIEDDTGATNMHQVEEKELIYSVNTSAGIDPLAMEIKEEDEIDEGNFFDEPLCDQNQTNIDEQATSNTKTDMRKSNNFISNIKNVKKDDLSQNVSNNSIIKSFISSKVLDNHSDGKTKRLMIVINPENLSKHNIIQKGEKDAKLSVKDNLDKDVIAIQHPDRNKTMAHRENINKVDSMKSHPYIHNIPSLKPIDTKQLAMVQSHLLTVSSINPSQDENRKQITTAQNSQIDSAFLKKRLLTERVQPSGTAVKGNVMHKVLTPGEIVKPDENVEPVMDKTRKNVPENKFVPRGTTKSEPAKIKVMKVTKSELNDFLEQARNNEAYLSLPFKCEYCILGFKEERFLQKHMSRYMHATISKTDYVCNICLSSMPSEKELNIHQSTHDCLYACTHDDFTSVLPLNVYHHYQEKHQLKKKFKTSVKHPQPRQTVSSQAGSKPSAEKTKKYKRKVKLQRYEVFKPTIEDFDYKRMMISLRPGLGRCMDCCLTFRHNDVLFEHRRAHLESAGEHMCDLCRLRFKTAELLNEHKPVHDKWYKCKADPDCLYFAQTLSTILMHISAKHPKTKMKKRRIRPDVSYECDVCKKVFTSRNSLKSHMLIHNKQHMCEECGHVCASSSNLIQHKRSHTTEPTYLVCEFCPKRFCNAHSLRYHHSRHLQVKPYACKLCDEKFYSPNARGVHIRRVHKMNQNTKINRYKCTMCHLEFSGKSSLTAHRSTHEEMQRYKCGKCPKSFYFFNSLVSHQESHAYTPRCDICGKVFVTKDNLEYHLHSKHSGGTEAQPVKPVKIKKQRECNECGKVFQSKKNWQDHMKTHLIFSEDMPELS